MDQQISDVWWSITNVGNHHLCQVKLEVAGRRIVGGYFIPYLGRFLTSLWWLSWYLVFTIMFFHCILVVFRTQIHGDKFYTNYVFFLWNWLLLKGVWACISWSYIGIGLLDSKQVYMPKVTNVGSLRFCRNKLDFWVYCTKPNQCDNTSKKSFKIRRKVP